MATLKYTGVGSRKAIEHPEMMRTIRQLGYLFAKQGLVLRSGGAEGCDDAFALGSYKAGGLSEIFLPWPSFRRKELRQSDPRKASYILDIPCEASSMAARIHPHWNRCTPAVKHLHSRNVCQVVGQELNDFSKFLICWTPEGKESGGTRTAIMLAKQIQIPVYNLGNPKFSDLSPEQIVEIVLSSQKAA